LAEIAWRYKHKGVCGFDLAGPEEGYSSKYHKDAISIVRRKFVNITLHSGEASGWESVRDSIQYCGAHRLGHGTRMRESQKLVDFVADNGIAVEICITSNVQTKAINTIRDHPAREYFDKGVIIVPCTDNVVVSGITLSHEYMILQEHFDFTLEEIIRIIDYGFKSAFLETSIKNRIRAEALRDCIQILRKEGFDVKSIVQNSNYFDWIGVNIPEIIEPLPVYWKKWTNPEITFELCKLLPKTDLHCKFELSLDPVFIYEELLNNEDSMNYAKKLINFDTKEEFMTEIENMGENDVYWTKIVYNTLRTKQQFEKAVELLFINAINNSIRYFEFLINPNLFTSTRTGATAEEILKIIINHTKLLNANYDLKTYAGIIIVSSSPDESFQMAKLAIKYQDDGVLGFAIDCLGLSLDNHKATIALLKENHIKSAFYAENHQAISYVLADAGAQRIFGANEIHLHPHIMAYLSNHNILLEISLEQILKQFPDPFFTFITFG